MIPYDDLVAALSAWRARQGLPVSALGGGSGPTPTPGSGPTAKPGSGPNRAAPPAPPTSRPAITPPPVVEEQVEEAMLDEEVYENEGNDFAMSFSGDAPAATTTPPAVDDGDGDATSIGSVPERPTEMDMTHEDDKDDW
jgi:hypothetical protein